MGYGNNRGEITIDISLFDYYTTEELIDVILGPTYASNQERSIIKTAFMRFIDKRRIDDFIHDMPIYPENLKEEQLFEEFYEKIRNLRNGKDF